MGPLLKFIDVIIDIYYSAVLVLDCFIQVSSCLYLFVSVYICLYLFLWALSRIY